MRWQFDCDLDLRVCDLSETVDHDLGKRCCAIRYVGDHLGFSAWNTHVLHLEDQLWGPLLICAAMFIAILANFIIRVREM